MKMIMTAFIFLSACTGQTILAPMKVEGRSREFVRFVPIFRNSGNLVNVDYHYRGSVGTVDFHAETIDNSTTTYSMWEGLTKFGRAIIQPIVYGITAAAAAPALAAKAQ